MTWFTLIFVGASTAAALLLAGLNWLLTGRGTLAMATLEEAVAALETDVIDFTAGDGVLCADGRAALLTDARASRIGLVIVRGDRLVTRVLKPGDVKQIRNRDTQSVTITLHDQTLPRVDLVFAQADQADHWARRLDILRGDDARSR